MCRKSISEGRERGSRICSNLNVAKVFHDIIDKNIGKNIEYKLVDNDVNWGEKPILIEEGKLKEKKIEVHDWERLDKFLRKQNLNPNAKSSEELYGHDYNNQQPIYKFENSKDIVVTYTNVNDQAKRIGKEVLNSVNLLTNYYF